VRNMAEISRTEALNGRKLPFERVALLLQGGGALGAYQAGVYQALHEARIEPDWVAGISIGAINSAIIAGNAPDTRIAQLRSFWEQVSAAPDFGVPGNFLGDMVGNWTESWLALWQGDQARSLAHRLTAARTMAVGAPGFFAARMPPPLLRPSGADGATSYYDTGALKTTLERLVDFDRINAADVMRFSVGAVNVGTGNFEYFDSSTHHIRAEHVMASGALPPAFAAVEVDGEFYWDGGIVSNTPLDWILAKLPLHDTLAFQVDLWSARGVVPRNLGEVAERLKEIQFSSRTRASTDHFRDLQSARSLVQALLDKLPPELMASPEAAELCRLADPSVHNIVQLIYKSPPTELESKDYNFSRAAMTAHWAQGYADAGRTLAHPEIFERPADSNGVQTFDFCSSR
ncbi:MAG: patatin-like phospholipase family protein, partial [Polymorphobacter sp.]